MTQRRGCYFTSGVFALALSLPMLFGSLEAKASGPVCTELFKLRLQATNLDGLELSEGELSGLNEPSREYLRRLAFLIRERRWLGPEVLEKILTSPRPFNPLTGRVPNVQMLPHLTAIDDLIREQQGELQWEQIRQVAKTLAQSVNQDQKREQTARQETELVLSPYQLRSFPFYFSKTLTTHQGQRLGVTLIYRMNNKTLTIEAYDLATGTRVSEINQEADNTDTSKLRIREIGQTVIATVPTLKNPKFLTFDLFKGTLIADPVLAPGEISSLVPLETNGELRLAATVDKSAYLVNPTTSTLGPEIPLSGAKFRRVDEIGTIGNSVYIAGGASNSILFDPQNIQAMQKNEKIKAIAAFTHQGKTYGYGVEMAKSDVRTMQFHLKSFDFATGQESKPLDLGGTSGSGFPKLLGQFEHDGSVYGILSLHSDAYLVDLIKNEIKLKLSETELGPSLISHFHCIFSDTGIFFANGKPYIPALIVADNWQEQSQLVILDATTFLPATTRNLDFPDKRAESLAVLPPTPEGEVYAVVNFEDQTSAVVALVSKLQRGANQ